MAFSQISLLPRRSSTWHCCGCLVLSFFVSALAALRFHHFLCILWFHFGCWSHAVFSSHGACCSLHLTSTSQPCFSSPIWPFPLFFPTKMYFWVHCSSSDLLLSRYLQLLVSSTMPSKPLSQSTSVSYFLKTSLTLPSRQFAACSSHSTYLFFYKLGHLRPV